ncbi:hypothetical protein CPB84DRAFT_1850159 [Gymnopilus junonius]|uniref:F-box domain-containing protein n=1 Tax=Gymnopilus junonius TaxID=109634 RepID=A0A9P5NH71_GYMJU|nr:hypothetical protein CPB84DRAFT_1850159 [Gymnopilus junonius]
MYPFHGLPQELVEEIKDCIDADSDASTLSALSRSCKAFLPWCQRRLFSTISFRCADYPRQYVPELHDPLQAKIEALLDILQSSPHIAGYVRRLEISITTQHNYWVTEEPFITIMEIINRSGNFIKELCLYAVSFPEQFYDLRALEQKFLQPFINPYITSLTISGLVNVPISLLTESVNLQDFTINHSALEHAFYPLQGDAQALYSGPKIRTLTFNPSMGVLETILTARDNPDMHEIVDFSRLRVIRTRSYPHNMQATKHIIQITKGHLEEFHMRHHINFKYLPYNGSIDFSEASGLRIIDIDVVFPSCSSSLGDPLVDLCSILNTLPEDNSLVQFQLCVYIGFYSRRDGPESSLRVNWESLDSELMRMSSGKPLSFHLHMIYSYDEESDTSSDEGEVDMEAENRYSVVEDLCRTTYKKLVRDRFPLINNSQHIILKLSQSVEID